MAKEKKKTLRTAEAFRYSQQIRGYFGTNGSGKTFGAVLDLMPSLKGVKWKCTNPSHLHTLNNEFEGYRKVLSNIVLDSPHYVKLENYQQILDAEHSDLLLDEIVGVAASSNHNDVPIQVKNWLHQTRRVDCTISYTGITYSRALKELREVTRIATFARGYIPIYEGENVWPSNQLFYYSTFDASELEQMEISETVKIKPINFQWYSRWTKKSKDIEEMYSTFDSVSSFNSEIAPVGLCLECGGTIRRHACSGH